MNKSTAKGQKSSIRKGLTKLVPFELEQAVSTWGEE
jgi:hypothetical protein